jgi:hypothetical protein
MARIADLRKADEVRLTKAMYCSKHRSGRRAGLIAALTLVASGLLAGGGQAKRRTTQYPHMEQLAKAIGRTLTKEVVADIQISATRCLAGNPRRNGHYQCTFWVQPNGGYAWYLVVASNRHWTAKCDSPNSLYVSSPPRPWPSRFWPVKSSGKY